MRNELFGAFLLICSVSPAVWVLSPARAPQGLHRALFMNSVSHGKIWTNNAASLWKGSIFLKRACLVVSVQESTLLPPLLPTLFFQRLIKGYNLCLRGGQLGGRGWGESPDQVRYIALGHMQCPPLPHPNQWADIEWSLDREAALESQVMYLKYKWVWVLFSNLKISCNSLFKRRVPPK